PESLLRSGALRIVERQPRSEMAAYLTMADVLVSPRAYGGNLPLKIFDYLAAGRPIVATDIPTHRSVLAEDRAVLVAPHTEAIAQGILAVLGDRLRAQRLAAAARSYAQTHLGWNRFVDSVEFLDADCLPARDWLRRLLQGHAAGAAVVGGALDLPPGLSPMARCDYYCGWYHAHSRRLAGEVPNHPPGNLSVRRADFGGTRGFTEQ